MPKKSLKQQLLERKDIRPHYEEYDGILIQRSWGSCYSSWMGGSSCIDHNYKWAELQNKRHYEREISILIWNLFLYDLVSKGSGRSYRTEPFKMDCGMGWTPDEAYKVGINFVIYGKLPDLSIGKRKRDKRVQVEIDRKVEDRRANAYHHFLELKEEFGFV